MRLISAEARKANPSPYRMTRTLQMLLDAVLAEPWQFILPSFVPEGEATRSRFMFTQAFVMLENLRLAKTTAQATVLYISALQWLDGVLEMFLNPQMRQNNPLYREAPQAFKLWREVNRQRRQITKAA